MWILGGLWANFIPNIYNPCGNCSLIKYWKRPGVKQNPTGIETGLARNLLQTVFPWKTLDCKKWSDRRKINQSINRSINQSINQSCQSPREEDLLPVSLFGSRVRSVASQMDDAPEPLKSSVTLTFLLNQMPDSLFWSDVRVCVWHFFFAFR